MQHPGLWTALLNSTVMDQFIYTPIYTREIRYYSVQTLLSKNSKVKIYKTTLPVILYGCETWSDKYLDPREWGVEKAPQ